MPIDQRAEDLANAVLQDAGWHSYPVDPVIIARNLGIVVRAGDLGNVSGRIVRDRETDWTTITLNVNDPMVRQRFTCAHEIGHYIKNAEDDPTSQFSYTDHRDDLSSSGTDPDERFANQFAAALLMPADDVRRMVEQHTPIGVMAKRFGVSIAAMGHRLANLGLNSHR